MSKWRQPRHFPSIHIPSLTIKCTAEEGAAARHCTTPLFAPTAAEAELQATRELAERAALMSAETTPAAEAETAAQQPPEAAQDDAAVALSITLAYESGWKQVYLHHSVDGKGVLFNASELKSTEDTRCNLCS